MISLEDSYRHCQEVVAGHYENFPVASRLMPARTRPAIAALYAFARAADDMSDEVPDTETSLALLAGWRELLQKAREGPVDHPVFRALADTIRRFDLPVLWLDRLIQAFERDRTVVRHEGFEDLIFYSTLSANPVGRLLLWINGYRDERLFAMSDAVCTALQLANFWQDISVDREKGRLYVPLAELRITGLDETSLFSSDTDPETARRHQRLKDRLFAYTAGLFSTGVPLPRAVGGRIGIELALVLRGGATILDAGQAPGRPVTLRPVLTRGSWIRSLLRPVTLARLESALGRLSSPEEARELYGRGRAVYQSQAEGGAPLSP